MIKVLEKGQTTFTRICDRCGCKFQYDLSDLSGLDYIKCPCCHTSLTHIGPKAVKIDPSKTNQINFPTTVPYKIEVGDGKYNYATATGVQFQPNSGETITVTADKVTKPTTLTGGDPNATIYANKLPDDIVDDPYNKIGSDLPDDVKDNCIYESEKFKEWQEEWVKTIKENKAVECKNK